MMTSGRIRLIPGSMTYGFQPEVVWPETTGVLAAMRAHDENTERHLRRVAMYSHAIAIELGYSKREAAIIGFAGLMHDIGKLFTPLGILQHPGSLSARQYKRIQGHVNHSRRILRAMGQRDAALVVSMHHERWDGSGYPSSRSGSGIHPHALVIAVADAWDAMNGRCYAPALSDEHAMQELMRPGQFEERCVRALRTVLETAEDVWDVGDERRLALVPVLQDARHRHKSNGITTPLTLSGITGS